MFNDYNTKRAKTTNFRLANENNRYDVPQSNTFRDIYINQFPTYYSQYGYENNSKNIPQPHYIQRRKTPEEFFEREDHYEKTMKNLNLKPNYFYKNETRNNIVQRSVKTFVNQSPNRLNQTEYIYRNNYNNINNMGKSHEPFYNYNENSNHQYYEGKKIPKKFYKNRIIKKKYDYPNEDSNNLENEDSLQPVAQKICNIIIKAEPKKDKTKQLKNDKKKKSKGFSNQNMEIEGNVSHGSAIAEKKNKLKNIPKRKSPYSPVNNNNYNIENKGEITLSGNKRKEKITPKKENIANNGIYENNNEEENVK